MALKKYMTASETLTRFLMDPRPALLRTFFDAKSDEIQSIFSDGPAVDITSLINNLNRMAPTKRSNWAEIKY